MVVVVVGENTPSVLLSLEVCPRVLVDGDDLLSCVSLVQRE